MRNLPVFFRPKWGIFRESFHHAALGSPKRRKRTPFLRESFQKEPKTVLEEKEAEQRALIGD